MAFEEDEKKSAYDVDAKAVEGQTASLSAPDTLHRKLKNRHVAMIRYIPLRSLPNLSLQLTFSSVLVASSVPVSFSERQIPSGPVVPLVFCWVTLLLERYAFPPWFPFIYLSPRHVSHDISQLSLGEMTAFLPLPGGFIKLAERFIDPAYALATGWNYWYGWTVRLLQLPFWYALSLACCSSPFPVRITKCRHTLALNPLQRNYPPQQPSSVTGTNIQALPFILPCA